LRHLNQAFKRVGQVKGTGFPKFKKKKVKDSFYLEGNIKVSGYWVKLPRIGWVKSHEQLPEARAVPLAVGVGRKSQQNSCSLLE
jgi:putative transposase